MNDENDGIWLEVSRVRIERKQVSVQVVGDQRDDRPAWWAVEKDALGEESGRRTYNAIAIGLDNADQVVIAKLSSVAAANNQELLCTSIRIQTRP